MPKTRLTMRRPQPGKKAPWMMVTLTPEAQKLLKAEEEKQRQRKQREELEIKPVLVVNPQAQLSDLPRPPAGLTSPGPRLTQQDLTRAKVVLRLERQLREMTPEQRQELAKQLQQLPPQVRIIFSPTQRTNLTKLLNDPATPPAQVVDVLSDAQLVVVLAQQTGPPQVGFRKGLSDANVGVDVKEFIHGQAEAMAVRALVEGLKDPLTQTPEAEEMNAISTAASTPVPTPGRTK